MVGGVGGGMRGVHAGWWMVGGTTGGSSRGAGGNCPNALVIGPKVNEGGETGFEAEIG